MYQSHLDQTPNSVHVGSHPQHLAATPSSKLSEEVSQVEPSLKPPMQSASWECQACRHENSGRSIACEFCQGSLPVIALFKAHKKYELERTYIQLSWEVFDATSVVMIPGHESLPLKGTMDINLDVGEEYFLIATNHIGSKELSTRAKALPPKIKSFEAVDTEVQIGYPIILQWEVENAARMEIDRGVGEVSGQSYIEVLLEEPGPITLTTTNEAGSTSATIELSMKAPRIQAFYALSDQIQLGSPNTLCWEVQNVSELAIKSSEGEIIPLKHNQRQLDILVEQTTSYTLMARNAVGYIKAECELFLPPPAIRYFTGDSNVSTEGSLVTLSWEVDHAYELTLEPGIGPVPAKGSVKVRPVGAFTVFSLEVKGHSGTDTQSFRIDQFPVPLEESLLLLEQPNLTDIMLHNSNPMGKKPEEMTPEELQQHRDYQIWRAQQMMLTDEMMRMEKASIRKEFNRIIRKFKKQNT